MSDKAAIKLERGTKRTCQNSDCGARFYDLNRDPIACPVCNTAYVIALQPPQPPARPAPRPLKRPAPVPHAVKEEVPTEEDVELATLEDEEESASVAEDDDTIIEEVEEDATDMSDIVDAPAAGEDGKE
jgi:hypothetical protein